MDICCTQVALEKKARFGEFLAAKVEAQHAASEEQRATKASKDAVKLQLEAVVHEACPSLLWLSQSYIPTLMHMRSYACTCASKYGSECDPNISSIHPQN